MTSQLLFTTPGDPNENKTVRVDSTPSDRETTVTVSITDHLGKPLESVRLPRGAAVDLLIALRGVLDLHG